jgi:Lhr-like helicase
MVRKEIYVFLLAYNLLRSLMWSAGTTYTGSIPIWQEDQIGMLPQKSEEVARIRKEAGRFILATNLVDDEKLKPEEIITNYKNQQSCVREACRRQRGFRFLKDPLSRKAEGRRQEAEGILFSVLFLF